MAEAVPLNIIPLREPANTNVLVAVGGDDVFFVRRERERRKERSMAEYERAVRRIFMGSQGAALRSTRRYRGERVRVGMERVTLAGFRED